jgi:glycosyltransferase involved in cell wall biosynthesis
LRWDILTGEYPPQLGGVSDYTHLVAVGLARAGDDVHVWAPVCPGSVPASDGVVVHRLADRFGVRALTELRATARIGARVDHRWFVQYVPHAFGWKAMNLPFCVWLWSRRRDPIWVMFHEVIFPWGWRRPLRHNALALVTRLMAFLVIASAQRIFVSIPAWELLIRRWGRHRRAVTWLPVPSTIPPLVDAAAVAAVRRTVTAGQEAFVVGHFGTFSPAVKGFLYAVLPGLLVGDSRRRAVLLGRGADAFATDLRRAKPGLRERLHAFDSLSAEAVAVHLAACDLLLQPYPDGVSSRRTSLMAGLALGLPIVTTRGPLTEPVWGQTEAVVLVPVSSPSAFVAAAEDVLADHPKRTDLRRRAAALYRNQFAPDRTIAALRAPF